MLYYKYRTKLIERGSRIMQVNNLKIKYSKLYKKWQVTTPDKRILEEFGTQEQAVKWAKTTKDFTTKRSIVKK